MRTAQIAALVGLVALVGCDPSSPSTSTPQAAAQPTGPITPSQPSFKELSHSARADALEGFYEIRLVPTATDRASVQQALQDAHDAVWKKSPQGTNGKPVTRFQAWAYANWYAKEKGELPIGILEHMGENAQLEWSKLPQ